MAEIRARITGLGKCVPKRVVTNHDLEKLMDTTDEWIVQRTGIHERRWAEPGVETGASMAAEACRGALKNAGRSMDDVDAIIYATIHSDWLFPGGGVQLQDLLCPDRPIPALDVRDQCSGFLYALSVADSWIRTGTYKTILVVGAEVQSTSLDVTTRGRDIAVLFGDGAGAALLEATTSPEEGIINVVLHSEGKYANKLWTQKPSTSDFPRIAPRLLEDPGVFPYMDGKFVFKHAVTRMCEVMGEALNKARLRPEQIDFVIAHQANMRINQMVLQQLGIGENKTFHTLPKYGNTTAATIPITMCEAREAGHIKKGDVVAMVGFGSGFTWGASLMRW